MSQITSVKRVRNNALQAEIIDEVQLNNKLNVLQALNKGDERFNPTRSPRHAWFPVTLPSLEDLGVSKEKIAEIEKLEYGQAVMLNIQDPEIAGEKLTIQVNESIHPDAYQASNVMISAKQLPISEQVAKNRVLAAGRDLSKYIGSTGYFLDKDGNHIFSRTIVSVESQVKHTIVEAASFIPKEELADFGATLAEPMKVEESVKA